MFPDFPCCIVPFFERVSREENLVGVTEYEGTGRKTEKKDVSVGETPFKIVGNPRRR